MRAIFGKSHAAVADFHHVRIVPVAGPGEGFEANLQVEDFDKAEFAAASIWPFFVAGPVVADVAGGAPEIADAIAPEPGLGGTPLAHAEDDGTAGGEKRVAHGRIGFFGVAFPRIAPIVFQVIDAPAGILERVLMLVALTARPSGTGLGAGVRVEAEL